MRFRKAKIHKFYKERFNKNIYYIDGYFIYKSKTYNRYTLGIHLKPLKKIHGDRIIKKALLQLHFGRHKLGDILYSKGYH